MGGLFAEFFCGCFAAAKEPVAACALLMSALMCACSSSGVGGGRGSSQKAAETFSMSDRKLLDLVEAEKRLFSMPASSDIEGADIATAKNLLDSRWCAYILESPSAYSHALYGKYLRRTGNSAMARAQFKESLLLDASNPSVHHLLASIEAEDGNLREANLHFSSAAELGADNAFYATEYAKFLVVASPRLADGKIISKPDIDALVLGLNRRAAPLNPSSFPYALRYAQCFYDVSRPDWNAALSAWNAALGKASLDIEKQTVHANMARVLIELGRDAEARRELEAVSNPSFDAPKRAMLEILNK